LEGALCVTDLDEALENWAYQPIFSDYTRWREYGAFVYFFVAALVLILGSTSFNILLS